MTPNPDPLKILIAEDSATDRLILETIVKRAGHKALGVGDGDEALEVYHDYKPDLVLLDVLMPNKGGIEAAKEIRQRYQEDLVPIIFLTSLSDQESLVECLEAGGDDFIPKPYNQAVLHSKIKAFGRLRRMHSLVTQQKLQIEEHNRHLIQEQTVAKQVFDKIAHRGCLELGNVRHYMSPLAVFNGDILVSEMGPNGNMLVMLGDFTGHGLPAAIGSMPLATTFYGMVRKGFNMIDVLREINSKLNDILPVGFFCCAICVEINYKERRLCVWNGGLPEAFLFHSREQRYQLLESKNLPLGVMPSKNFKGECEILQLEYGDRLYMWSDGVFEARNQTGEMFGENRLHDLLYTRPGDPGLFGEILARVHAHIGDSEKDDDVSLVEIEIQDIDTSSVIEESQQVQQSKFSTWQMSLNLESDTLKDFDPLPLLMNILAEVPGLGQHRTELYTVIAELYSNALEHGVLALDSALKSSPDGFAKYYAERERRLGELFDGSIRINLAHRVVVNGGVLDIRVKDSGEGFTPRASATEKNGLALSGRGLGLIEQLAETLTVHPPGNDVEVLFCWSREETS